MRDALGSVTKSIAHRVRSYITRESRTCGSGFSRDALAPKLQSRSIATEVAPTTTAADP